MPSLGAPELIIILVVVIIIFGVGRLPEIGGALGRGIREFRSAAKDDEEQAKQLNSETKEPPASPTSSAERGKDGGAVRH